MYHLESRNTFCTCIINVLSKQPILWDIFEAIFGANGAKRKLYRSVISDHGRMLDFGCSTGNITSAFLDFEYHGVDICREYIERAKTKWKNHPRVKFIQGDLLDKLFPKNYFDFIIFGGTGHHLKTEQIIQLLKEMRRILKQNGKIYFFDTIKPKREDNFVTQLLVNIDQGKYVRGLITWRNIFEKIKGYRIAQERILFPKETLFHQPNYVYFKLVKL